MKLGFALADKKLQRNMELAFPGFGAELMRASKSLPYVFNGFLRLRLRPSKTEVEQWELTIPMSSIKRVPLYDPDDWNAYPEITPPEGVLMRVEMRAEMRVDGTDLVPRACAVYKDGRWCNPVTTFGQEYKGQVVRFRPWED